MVILSHVSRELSHYVRRDAIKLPSEDPSGPSVVQPTSAKYLESEIEHRLTFLQTRAEDCFCNSSGKRITDMTLDRRVSKAGTFG